MLATSLLHDSRSLYVDVETFHQGKGANTNKLNLRGRAGLTIEPNPATEAEFRRMRRRDRHLVMGVSAAEEALTYYEFDAPKHNTFSTQAAAANPAGSDPGGGLRRLHAPPSGRGQKRDRGPVVGQGLPVHQPEPVHQPVCR